MCECECECVCVCVCVCVETYLSSRKNGNPFSAELMKEALTTKADFERWNIFLQVA